MVLRVIFDTNIFGNLLEEPDTEEIETRINKEKDFIVYIKCARKPRTLV